jgi:transcriptional regulator
MLKGIVGIEIPIDSVTGKWKTSQNRPLPDKLGIVAGLHANGDSDSRRMVALIQRHTARQDDS